VLSSQLATLWTRREAGRVLYATRRRAGATTLDSFVDACPARDQTAPWDKRQPYRQQGIAVLLEHADPLDRVA
jgi:hypothetical protein